MSDTHTSHDNDNRTLYRLIGVFVAALMIVSLFTYSSHKSDQQSQQKAQQLVTKFEQAGLPVPDDDVEVLGHRQPRLLVLAHELLCLRLGLLA